MTSLPTDRPVRSDARRNRARLIEAATEAFREEGLEVGVDAIARRAGVGVATLYRHFPTKADLVLAIMESVIDDFGAAARHAVATGKEELVVARFLKVAMTHQARNRGFLEALAEQDLPDAMRDRLADRVVAILEPVVVAGHRSGTLRADVDAIDLLVVVKMLGLVSAARRRRPAERYLQLLLRGLAP